MNQPSPCPTVRPFESRTGVVIAVMLAGDSRRPLVMAMSQAAKSRTFIITPPLGAITRAAAVRRVDTRHP